MRCRATYAARPNACNHHPFETRDNGPPAPLHADSDVPQGKPNCRQTDLSVACPPRSGRQRPGPGTGGALLVSGRNAPGSDWMPAAPAGRTIAGFLPASGDQGPRWGFDLPGCGKSILSAQPAPRRVGLLIGSVYRFRVTNIPLPQAEGLEVYPTIEIIDRTYAPVDQQVRFAIPVEIVLQDIDLALQGKFVTRVIYVENPRTPCPPAPLTASLGLTSRRAAMRWPWPTNWAGRWQFFAWAAAFQTWDRTPTIILARRRGSPIHRERPGRPGPSARLPRPNRLQPRKRSPSHGHQESAFRRPAPRRGIDAVADCRRFPTE